MICKRCGATIPPGETICPKCDENFSMKGGNGFWDLAHSSENSADETMNIPDKTVSKDVRKDVKPFFLLFIILTVQVIIAFVASYFFTKNTQKQIEDQFLRQIESIAQESTEAKHQLDEKIGLLEQRIAEMENTISEIKKDAPSDYLIGTESNAVLELKPGLERGKMDGAPPTEIEPFDISRGE